MEKEKNVEINSIPRLFWDSVETKSNRIAMREKHLGIWQATTWEKYGKFAMNTGLALHALGLKKGDVVSIAGEGIPEWLFTDMGTIAVGGISSGVYTTDSSDQVRYLVNDSKTKFYFAENEEQLVSLPNGAGSEFVLASVWFQQKSMVSTQKFEINQHKIV